MDLQITNKTAFISGSTKGIGFATALGLAKEGVKVWLNGRSEMSVDAAKARLLAAVPDASVSGIAADLSTAAGCNAVVNALPAVDILVNNLGIFEPKPFEAIPDEDWFRFFETNVMSGVRLSRHYLPLMKQQNWGRIIFVSSESAIQIPEEMIHYGMTKTAQIALARGLAESTKGTAVTVNTVLPGPSRSEGVETFVQQIADQQGMTFGEMEREFFNNIRPSSLIQRFATPEEDANMIVYLCGVGAAATNGAALRVDGGVVRAAL
ncbi:SDR family NAD(P)-dependent oxidoreductase [Thiothrix lacustris]|jgi:NAD(P)-dependent dehydrogenase (short-subunit alcohol dehydrogenase family)|uniref:SDR family NAD(P)-dependent oxidoreductase n=1 Tax=Thiothrix lacustris TaxID=525917 RepID=UPI00048BAAFE|nr:SDR family oxidoreductase [Thiothrix lacustris]